MSRVILVSAAILILILWVLYRGLKTPEEKRHFVQRLGLGSLIFVLIILVLTGRIHVLFAAVAAIIPFLKRILSYLRYLPAIKKFLQAAKGEPDGDSRGPDSGDQSGSVAGSSGQMSRAEALKVLGLAEGASRDEIVEAHRHLMLKCHPDKGGNDYLAAKLNQAKECLLKT